MSSVFNWSVIRSILKNMQTDKLKNSNTIHLSPRLLPKKNVKKPTQTLEVKGPTYEMLSAVA